MFVDLLLGLQWGDEGKGKIVDAIAKGPMLDILSKLEVNLMYSTRFLQVFFIKI